MPLSRYSVGTYQVTSSHITRQGTLSPQLSQLAEPPWTDPGLKSGISMRELISIKRRRKKAWAGNELLNILPKSSHTRKSPPRLATRHWALLQSGHGDL